MTEIKVLLGQALDDRPPSVALGRDVVIAAGRRAYRRRRAVQVAGALGAVAGLAFAGNAVAGQLLPSGAAQQVAVAATPSQQAAEVKSGVLEKAAERAAAQPYTAPREGQWLYVETKNVAPGAFAKSKGQQKVQVYKNWYRLDGLREAAFNELTGGVDEFDSNDPQNNLCRHQVLNDLPTDPRELLRWVENRSATLPKPPPDFEYGPNEVAFGLVRCGLEQPAVPPAVRAALLRAAALIPGVTESAERVDVDGRAAIEVGRPLDDWRRLSLLFDAETYEYLGVRSVATVDRSFPVEADGRSFTVEVKAGEVQHVTTVQAAVVVDAPGRTR